MWDSSSSGSISVDSKDVHEENVAYIIENSVIVESLLEATQESDNVQIKYETRINNVDFPVAEVKYIKKKKHINNIVLKNNNSMFF